MPDDGHLVDLLNEWTPDARHRQRILVIRPRACSAGDRTAAKAYAAAFSSPRLSEATASSSVCTSPKME